MNENSLGSKIADLRRKRNMTQSDLAWQLGMSTSSVAMWETGKRDPDSEMISSIANFFDVTSDYLLGLSLHPNDLLNREIGVLLIYLANDDGHFHNEVVSDLFLLFEGRMEEANMQDFDNEFREYLKSHHNQITKKIFDDMPVQLFHIFYNPKTVKRLMIESEDTQWKDNIKNSLTEIANAHGLGIFVTPLLKGREFVYEVELTDPSLKHKIQVDGVELSDKDIKKFIASVRLDREYN